MKTYKSLNINGTAINKEELNNLGVELIRRKEETLAYSPSLVRGKPGKAYISQGSSYSAWSHEMQHVRDDFNDGWTGMRILENPEKRYQREVKAYNVEIKMESLHYEHIRWIENKDEVNVAKLVGTSDMKKVKDLKGNPLLLFVNPWSVGMTLERNEGLVLSEFGRE